MGVLIGLVVAFASLLGGYMALGGHLSVLWEPFEFVIIFGIALGTFQRFGLKMHDEVVQMEIARAAEHAGGRVVETTIPEEYGAL